jgi:PPOX class probable F420-dependent enzyme
MSVFDLETAAGAAAEAAMSSHAVGWLTTVARDGTPQSSVMAFLWDGEVITVLSEPEAPKVINLVENHRCSFHLNCDEFGMRAVGIEGTVHLPPGPPSPEVATAFLAKYGGILIDEWDLDPDETLAVYSQVIVITPRRVRVW